MDSLIYCLNAILPIFILILLGRLLAWKGGADSSFIDKLNGYVYKWLIPSVLFTSVYNADLSTALDIKLLGFCFTGTLTIFFAAWFLSSRLLRRSQVAAFTQSSFRGNYNLMVVPLVTGLLGSDMLPKAIVMSPVFVALYSTLAVTILTIYSDEGSSRGLKKVRGILIGIITNPFIIATLIGLALNLIGLTLPAIIMKPIEYINDMATPVALIGLGGALRAKTLENNLRPALAAAVTKTLFTPLIMIPSAILLGFRGVDLGIIAVLFSTPVAVNAYPTAKALGGDADMTSGAILLSTALSVISLVITMTALMTAGFV